MNLFDNNGAEFSTCRKYRYALWRIWDDSKPLIMFVGLNPSTANESNDDPTIRRVRRFAMDWGYGGVYMVNLFALISPYPEDIKKSDDPLGDNDDWLEIISKDCEKIIFAWGAFPEAEERAKEVIEQYDGYALVINKDGSPRHPLYVKADVEPVKYNTKKISYG